MTFFISIDPGSQKCGLILADTKHKIVLEGKIVEKDYVIALIKVWERDFDFTGILLGDGTSSDFWNVKLIELGLAPIYIVDEKGSTLKARDRYWELWPPSWYLKWLPKGLIMPPVDLDALAALILLEDYFDQKFTWEGTVDFTI